MKKVELLVMMAFLLISLSIGFAEGMPVIDWSVRRSEQTADIEITEPSRMCSDRLSLDEMQYDRTYVFDSEIHRSEIAVISFCQAVDEAPEDAWDISLARDNTVLAWVQDGTLTIAANGGVLAPEDSSWLFAGYENASEILFNGCFNTCNVTNMEHMFEGCSSLTSVDLSGFDTSNVADMEYMFADCSSMICLDLSSFSTSCVKDMTAMFSGCNSLTSLDVNGFSTSNVTCMISMFSGCRNLTSVDLSGINTSNVENMGHMFSGCSNLAYLDVSGFDTRNVTNMGFMFSGCSNAANLNVRGLDTSKVIDLSYMFSDCHSLTSLDVSGFDTSSVMYMEFMFSGCSSLTSLNVNGLDTSSVTDMRYMFSGCKDLMNLDLSGFDTNNVMDMQYMFAGSSNLASLNVSDSLVIAQSDKKNMFYKCPATVILNGMSLSSADWMTGVTSSSTREPEVGYITLRKGDKGDEVLKLQKRLYILGFLQDVRDGVYGMNTQSAVMLFQQAVGLEDTGVADSVTQQQLYANDAPKTECAFDMNTQIETTDLSGNIRCYVRLTDEQISHFSSAKLFILGEKSYHGIPYYHLLTMQDASTENALYVATTLNPSNCRMLSIYDSEGSSIDDCGPLPIEYKDNWTLVRCKYWKEQIRFDGSWNSENTIMFYTIKPDYLNEPILGNIYVYNKVDGSFSIESEFIEEDYEELNIIHLNRLLPTKQSDGTLCKYEKWETISALQQGIRKQLPDPWSFQYVEYDLNNLLNAGLSDTMKYEGIWIMFEISEDNGNSYCTIPTKVL